MVIYKITNKLNNKSYIGQTIRSVKSRWNRHCSKTSNSAISKAIQKYGKHNFEFRIIIRAETIDELNHREQYFIKLLNTVSPNGYNLEFGGKNKTTSEETKLRQSLSHLGLKYNRKRKPKYKKKVQGWINPNIGKTTSPESKLKNAIAHGAKFFVMKDQNENIIWQGVILSECARQFNLSIGNISECLKGRRKQHKGFSFKYIGDLSGIK
jgi:group I intron endonuclease